MTAKRMCIYRQDFLVNVSLQVHQEVQLEL